MCGPGKMWRGQWLVILSSQTGLMKTGHHQGQVYHLLHGPPRCPLSAFDPCSQPYCGPGSADLCPSSWPLPGLLPLLFLNILWDCLRGKVVSGDQGGFWETVPG